MKRGRLTDVEKYAIRGMIEQGKSLEDIMELTDRSEKVVRSFMDEIQPEPEPPQEEGDANIDFDITRVINPDHIAIVRRRLEREVGVSDADIEHLINKSLRIAFDRNQVFVNEDKLYQACIFNMRAGQYIIKRTAGKKESGVAIMTPIASQRMDEASKRNRAPTSRKVRQNTYNPSTGEMN